MKQGITVENLINEVKRRDDANHDMLVHTPKLTVLAPDQFSDDFRFVIENQGEFDIMDRTHKQIASRTGIPARYYDRMMHGGAKGHDLLIDNMRHWFNDKPERRMIRTLDGHARAFLSDQYRRIDNWNIMKAVLPAIKSIPNHHFMSCNVTDEKLYIKVLFPEIEAEVKPGDTVKLGLIITNSEVGNGSAAVQVFFYRDFCTNGCVFGRRDAFDFKRTHVGGKLIEGINHTIISSETQKMDDEVLIRQMEEVTKAAVDRTLFNKMVAKLREATQGEQIVNPVPAVEVLAKEFNLTKDEEAAALINLCEDKDYSRYGALNAVTKIANTHESYDRASELEVLGGKILDMPNSLWHRIAIAEAA